MYGPLASRAIELYSTHADSVDPTYGSPLEQWAGDIGFRCDSILQASWHANAGQAAYVYQFNRIAPGREPVGAVHTAEMWYLFGTLGLGTSPPGRKPRYNEDDRAVASTIQRYWANFARNGDPNGPGLSRWDRFEPSTQPILDFASAEPTQKHGVRREYCDLYIDNLGRPTQNQ
jgi:para-nitrobenzyl esterase